MEHPYMPCFLVFLSGIGFSIQSLVVKLLEERTGFDGSFQLVFWRGFMQMLVSYAFIYIYRTEEEPNKDIFGSTTYAQKVLFMRAFAGFGGIAFAFVALEKLPLGDSTVLVMLSPVCATGLSFLIIGEPWRFAEFIASMISLIGAAFIAKPAFIFGDAKALDPLGVLFALASSASAGMAYTCVRLLGTSAKMPWWNVCFAQALGQWMLALPCLIFTKQYYVPRFGQLLVILLTGFLGSWSQIAMTVGMQREKSAIATGMRMSDVVFGFIWQVLFTNDSNISVYSITGACLVILSVALLVLAKPSPDAQKAVELVVETSNKVGAAEYSVVRPDEDMDASVRHTSIDISAHDSVSSPMDNSRQDTPGTPSPANTDQAVRKRLSSLG